MVTPITVCMAVYNGMPYLEQQLASLAAQDDPAFRVLIQDDGSTDASAACIRAFCDRDPRFFHGAHQGEHLGPAGNFLDMLTQVSGLIALCDQDDVWQKNRLSRTREEMARAEQTHPGLPCLVHSDLSVIDSEGRLLFPSMFQHQGWDFSATGLPAFLVQNNVTGCTMLLNEPLRALAVKAIGSDLFMHDWLIAQTAAAFGTVFPIAESLVSYRQHAHNQIGASQKGTLSRVLHAVTGWKRTKARMDWNWREAECLRDTLGKSLPPQAQETLETFLHIRRLPKLHRAPALIRGGFLMQSPMTRLGQLLLT